MHSWSHVTPLSFYELFMDSLGIFQVCKVYCNVSRRQTDTVCIQNQTPFFNVITTSIVSHCSVLKGNVVLKEMHSLQFYYKMDCLIEIDLFNCATWFLSKNSVTCYCKE